MPTQGTVNGRTVAIYVEGTKITCQTNSTLELTMEPRESTCKDDTGNAAAFLGGQTSWTLGGEAKLAWDSAYGFSELYSVWQAAAPVTVVFKSTVSGDKQYSGEALLTSLSADTPDNEDSTFSFSFQGTGELVEAASS